jgi:hypothetical protein
MSTTKLINRRQIKEFALAVAQTHRPNRFSRVSGEFLLRVEGQVKEFIRSYIHQLPSAGKTIK